MLKGEIDAAAEHSEIIPGPVDNAKTQVVRPTEMAGEPKFETGAKLGEEFGFTAEMFGLRINFERVRRPLRVERHHFRHRRKSPLHRPMHKALNACTESDTAT